MLRTMERPGISHHNLTYARPSSLTSRNQSTSSAFSPSAHPHEDWTKITDLAERRRIQNRIAQRNYRKKLKKKFEDLERRAATSGSEKSASSSSSRKKDNRKNKTPTISQSNISLPTQQPQAFAPVSVSDTTIGFLSMPEESMFLDQFSKTVSLSPPATFTYPTTTVEPFSFPTYSSSLTASAMTTSLQGPTAAYSFQQPFPSPYQSPVQHVEVPVKTESYPDVGMSTFAISFAAVPSIEVTAGQFGDQLPHTPPRSDSFDSGCHSPEPNFFSYGTLPSPTSPPELI